MSALRLVYHVPRSQVWAGSGGRQTGNVHLHVTDGELVAGRIRRTKGQALCGRAGWYERPPDPDQVERLPTGLCPRCAEIAARIPSNDGALAMSEDHKFPEGDPVEVLPADSRAESQSGLNDLSGGPTSPSGRVIHNDGWMDDPAAWPFVYERPCSEDDET